MSTMEELTDMRELNGCTMASTEESRWKEATQRYIANMLLRNLGLRTALLNGTYRESPTIRFTINERGHIRDINAPACVDRVIQKSVSLNVLIPAIRPHLIYDNYASLKDRGTHFARRRFMMMLRSYIRANGIDGYVLIGDMPVIGIDEVDETISLPAVRFTAPFDPSGENVFSGYAHVPMTTFKKKIDDLAGEVSEATSGLSDLRQAAADAADDAADAAEDARDATTRAGQMSDAAESAAAARDAAEEAREAAESVQKVATETAVRNIVRNWTP